MSDLNHILLQEEILWRQRAKTKWLKECDLNAGYFYKVAYDRLRHNNISSIRYNNMILTD